MKKYELIGLTGTTGAGKGQAAKILSEKGYSIIDADSLARKAVENPLVLQLLSLHFGEDIVCDGKLQRKLLGQRAFADKEKTALLNSITHPFISAIFVTEVEILATAGADKILFDAPQLFESKLNVLCDRIIGIIADENVCIKRIMSRDGITKEEAEKRIKVQFSQDFFRKNCDYIIENNGTIEDLKEKLNQ